MKTLVKLFFKYFIMKIFTLREKKISTSGKLIKHGNIVYIVALVFMFLVNVSHATNYYVSTSGSDSNSGTSESQPWKSLTKVNSFTFSPGDQILFKRGEEWSGTITVKSSGTSGSPIVYGAYGSGDKPKIYGSEEITGWTKYSGNIYKASFSKDIEQLFVDDTRMMLARTPNSGYHLISSVGSSTTYSSESLNSSIDYTGAIWIGRTEAWSMVTLKVQSSSANTVRLESAPTYDLNEGEGFILIDKLDLLDSSGEWYYDSSSQTVYLWHPDGSSPDNSIVRASVYSDIISMSGVEYIEIKNLNLLHGEKSIYTYISSNLVIENIEVFNPAITGIQIAGGSSDNVAVNNNYIEGAIYYGIKSSAKNSEFSGNEVVNTAMHSALGKSGLAVNSGNSIESRGDNNVISYNRIKDSGYNGIRFYGINTEVKYNFIDGACVVLDDGGGIYSWSSDISLAASEGSVVKNNIVLNVDGNIDGRMLTDRMKGHGIYMDNNMHDVLIENNTVAYCGATNIFLHDNGDGMEIVNNTLMGAKEGVAIYQDSGGERNVKNNIIYSFETNTLGTGVERILGCRYNSYGNFDYNTYINHYNTDEIFNNQLDYVNFNTWRSKTGQDTNSTMDNSPLADGEIEQLFYNDTKQTKSISLGSTVYRDIDGNQVSGSISLEPFTSKILIKTTSGSSSTNNSPVIQDQNFQIQGDMQAGGLVGQIVATDADAGQTLSYVIIEGNDDGMFAIDATTGEIVANTTISETSDKSVVLVIEVSDNDVSPLSASASITINISGTGIDAGTGSIEDVTAPTISSFSIPSSSSSLTVAVSSVVASDNSEVTGYLLTTTSDVPSSSEGNWTSSIPASYTFSEEGSFTLYCWAKDASGNISSSLSASVTITLPDLSSTYSYYAFEETSGAEVIDSEGSNNGTIVNEELRVDGVKGSGLQLTGIGYISLGQCFGINVTDQVTVSAWIKPSGTTGDYQGVIMHGGPTDDSFSLYIQPSSKTVAFKTTATSSAWTYINNVEELWDGDWHLVTATYNGAEKVIYLDGEAITSVSATGTIESGEGYNLLIGAGRDLAEPTLLYKGLIDEVRIYNYGLTSTEVANLYNLVNEDLSAVYTTENIFICEGSSYEGYTSAGQYQRTLTTSTGGDSTVVTYLTVYPVYNITEDITISEGENYLGWTISGEYVRTLSSVWGCDSIVTTNLLVEEVSSSHFKTVWDGENGFNHMSINVLSASQYGVPLEAGDEISVYDGDKCVGTAKLEASIDPEDVETYLQLRVSQDDGSGNGFTENNAISFRIWDSSEQSEEIINHVTYNDDISSWETSGVFVANGTAVVELDIIVNSQFIELKEGWNIFSSYLIPENQSMDTIQKALVDNDELLKVQDELGNTYEKWNTSEGWVNNIGNLVETEGYKIRVKNDCVLEITGEQVSLPLDIDLNYGWNIISFPIISETNAIDVLQPLIDAGILVKVQDESGNSIEYWEMMNDWFNGIGNFKPGEGYMVQVNTNGVLQIDNDYTKSVSYLALNPETEYFIPAFEGNGLNHMNINIIALDNTNLQIGDEIAAYDGDICVGAIKLTETHFDNNVVSISASLSDLDSNNGFTAGNDIEIYVWSEQWNEEHQQSLKVIQGDLLYEAQTSVFVSLEKSIELDGTSSFEIDMYPNPANNQVTIKFSFLPEPGSKIILMDMNGKQLQSREVQSTHEVIDIHSYPTGIYLVKTIVGNSYGVKKLIKN